MSPDYNDLIAQYLRPRFNLPENWHVKSVDNIDNGVLVYGVIAPPIARGPHRGKPNFRQESGRVWKLFMTGAEINEALRRDKPEPALDYQHCYCAEYAIALHSLLRQRGMTGHNIFFAVGERFDEDRNDRIPVNIHCVVVLPDGTEVDSNGPNPEGYLADWVEVWTVMHFDDDNDPTSENIVYSLATTLIADFADRGLPIHVPAIAVAARDVLRSDYYQKMMATLTL